MPETIIESVLTGKLDSKLLIKWLNDESLEDTSEDCILNCCNKNDFVTCFLSFLRTQTDSTPEKLLSTRRKHRRSISDPTSEDRTMDSLSVKTDRQRSHESPSKDRKRTGRRVKTKLFNEEKSINQSASSDESRLSTGVDKLILSSTPMKNGIKPSDYPTLSLSSPVTPNPVTPRSFVKEQYERCDTPRLSHRHSRSQEKSCLGDYIVNVTKSSKKKKGRSSTENDDAKPELDLTSSDMFPEIGARKASSLRSEKRRIKPTNIDKSQKSISLNSFSAESIQTSPSLVEENSVFKQQRIQVKETNSFEAERNLLKQERHKLMEKFNILNTSSPQKVKIKRSEVFTRIWQNSSSTATGSVVKPKTIRISRDRPSRNLTEWWYQDTQSGGSRSSLRGRVKTLLCTGAGPSNFDITKEYLALSKKLGLLAKFLGLLASLPYTQLVVDPSNKNTVAKVICREVNYSTPKEKVLANDLALRNYVSRFLFFCTGNILCLVDFRVFVFLSWQYFVVFAVLCKDVEAELKTLIALGDLAMTTCHKTTVDVSAMTTPGAQFTAQHVSAAACVINLKVCIKPKEVNESFLSKLHAIWNVCCPDRKRSPPQEITLPERREELSPQFRNFEDEERAPTPISDEEIPTKIVIINPNPETSEKLTSNSEKMPTNSENSEKLPRKSGSQGQESDDSDVNLEFFDRILCPRNIMLLSDGKCVDVWEAMATVLVFLLKHDYLSEDSLTEQCLAVYRQDWSQ
ncbi:hypothetical protein HF086_007655, partial [Spodoptera exigua]